MARVKGITVEIGGNTGPLEKALQGVNSTIKTTQTSLKDVEKLLKLDPTNTELLRQKQDLLKDAIGATKDKLDALNPMFFDTPALALRSVYDILLTQLQVVRQNIEKSFGLINEFDESVYQEMDRINKTLKPHEHIGALVLRSEPFEKTATQKIKRY